MLIMVAPPTVGAAGVIDNNQRAATMMEKISSHMVQDRLVLRSVPSVPVSVPMRVVSVVVFSGECPYTLVHTSALS